MSALFEGAVLVVALREFFKAKPKGKSVWQAIRTGKDPTVFTVVFEDTAALLGLLFAFAGVFFGHLLNEPRLDGVASVVIGVLLAGVAAVLAWESKGLLIGESADPTAVRSMKAIAEADPAVRQVCQPMTMHLGPDQILLTLDLKFEPNLTAEDVERAVDRVEKAIRQAHPDVRHIYIEAESLTPQARAEATGGLAPSGSV